MSLNSFNISIKGSVLDDVRQRLLESRWPLDVANEDWSYGANAAYLRELVDYWLNAYDWRAHERAMNKFAHFRTELDGVPIHFIHEKGKGPKPIPLIMSHGWPWTFWDLQKVIGPLTDPAAHGGDARDSFDVVVPSLPGFGFSTPLTAPGINFWRTGDMWHTLMTKLLGYKKFAAQGGDFGALVTSHMGHKYADDLYGVHLHFLVPISGGRGGGAGFPVRDDYAPHEQAWYERNVNFLAKETGYSVLQRTKPQSLSYGMHDSPLALLAWLVEKRRAWSDCDGDVERVFSKDDLITTAMIYWATESFGSAARYYAEAVRYPWQASHDGLPVVRAPTAALVFPKEVLLMPQGWVARYFNLKRWTVAPRGGHFAPMEQPGMLVEDLRAFFRAYR
jgi:pimeloyl-ACP methyl ester carboxylesterase